MPQRVRCISNLGAIPKVESELCPIRSKLSKIETTTLLLLIAFPWSLSQIWSTPIRVSLCFSLCYRESLLALLPSPRSNHNFVPFWESLLKSRPQCSCFKLPFEDLCLKLDSDSGKYLSKRLGEISLWQMWQWCLLRYAFMMFTVQQDSCCGILYCVPFPLSIPVETSSCFASSCRLQMLFSLKIKNIL